jgi:hypothetical protein
MNAAFTIVTIDYLAHAKTLGDSLVAHNPDIKFNICLIGDKKEVPDPAFLSKYLMIDTASLNIMDFAGMRERYNDFELSCALKPFFAEYLFVEQKAQTLIYFDSDILIFNSLQLIEEKLRSYDIILTPHCTDVIDRKDKHSLDLMLLNYGLYNAGFFALSNTAEATNFIKWWKDKMLTECTTDLSAGKYVDQIWLNLVPVYFEKVHILKDKGYNMAVWNMYERSIYKENEIIMVNDQSPLVFFHFSGYDLEEPEVLSKNHNYFTFVDRPEIFPLFKEYTFLLKQNRIEMFKKLKKTPISKYSNEEAENVGKKILKKIFGK